ncbi:hypothetical protein [Chromobacterium violaceum]|uniref:hypothetical protein n=1 Tax=Chromobacterium violaceum TaxID=536 RepID=UPI001C6EC27D|nr:hypothetical protein [Chromobacterium violaceum]
MNQNSMGELSMSARQLDVGDLINRQRFSARQWRILMLCFLIVLCDGFDTAAIGYIAPAVIRDWGVARTQLGPVMSAALWAWPRARCWRGRWPTASAASACCWARCCCSAR